MGEGFHLTPNRLQNRQQTRISSTLRDSKAAHPQGYRIYFFR